MDDQTQRDIRSLLKTFGIQADEAIQAHIAGYAGSEPLILRITLEDLTDYGEEGPSAPLFLEVEGQVRR